MAYIRQGKSSPFGVGKESHGCWPQELTFVFEMSVPGEGHEDIGDRQQEDHVHEIFQCRVMLGHLNLLLDSAVFDVELES
jgi:hypothetical protein